MLALEAGVVVEARLVQTLAVVVVVEEGVYRVQ